MPSLAQPNAMKPEHVAIVMDGNGRWATQRFLPRVAGHRQGVESLRRCVQACTERGIRMLTVFAFSSENWTRPVDEVAGLMGLMSTALANEVASLQRNGVRIRFVGDVTPLSARLRDGLLQAELATAGNQRLLLNVCFNYGGRWDIARAAAALAERGVAITEASLSQELSLSDLPDPDLIVRTGGEQRLSNFLLWQAAYAELYFTEKLWPEFDETELDAAIAAFAQRERRFGGLGPDTPAVQRAA